VSALIPSLSSGWASRRNILAPGAASGCNFDGRAADVHDFECGGFASGQKAQSGSAMKPVVSTAAAHGLRRRSWKSGCACHRM
jgi:hypothetical protein